MQSIKNSNLQKEEEEIEGLIEDLNAGGEKIKKQNSTILNSLDLTSNTQNDDTKKINIVNKLKQSNTITKVTNAVSISKI